MVTEHLKQVIDFIEDKKVSILEVIDVRYMSTYAEYFVLALAQNERQIAAVMDTFKENVPTSEKKNVMIEGTPQDGWVVIQYYEVAVQLFLPALHETYRLDELYEDAQRIRYE